MAIARLIRATNNFDALPAAARNRIIFWTRRFIRDIQRSIQADMSKPKTGRTYIINGKKHIASAPGEAPAILTGNLYRDLNPRYTNGGMRAVISPKVKSKTGAPYPEWLELGSPGGRIAPRPYLQKNFNRFRQAYRDKIQQILSEVINA